jgi:WD repeat-containing protein 35
LTQARELLSQGAVESLMDLARRRKQPRLWTMLAEHALEKLDLETAETAWAHARDWHGLQLVKRLRSFSGQPLWKQRFEAWCYLGQSAAAEAVVASADRLDLAVEMYIKLGDWGSVHRLVEQGLGDDVLATKTFNGLGDARVDAGRWQHAVGYYVAAKNSAQAFACFRHTGDVRGLDTLLDALPSGDPLLGDVGDVFARCGYGDKAVTAYLKLADVKRAIDCCVALHEWDIAVDLAQEYNFAQYHKILAGHAAQLRHRQQIFRAVELYQRALEHGEAAKLLLGVAKESATSAAGVHAPLRTKKLYVLAALEMEQAKRRALVADVGVSAGAGGGGGTTALGTGVPVANRATRLATRAGQTLAGSQQVGGRQHTTAAATQQTLAGLMKMDATDMSLREAGVGAWQGALAYHFWLLAHRGVYEGTDVTRGFEPAMYAALQAARYEDILGVKETSSVLVLTSYYAGYLGVCSRALTRLQLLEGLTEAEQQHYRDLAFALFTQQAPEDPPGSPRMEELASRDVLTGVCVASGEPLPTLSTKGETTVDATLVAKCKTCGFSSLKRYVVGRLACPLCHASWASSQV